MLLVMSIRVTEVEANDGNTLFTSHMRQFFKKRIFNAW